MKYKSLTIGTKEYSNKRQIESILTKKNIFWLIDCEFEDAEILISRGKVTWKNGTWYNGIWKGHIWENGDWYYGTWTDGTWLGGTFHNGIWNEGVFEEGEFVHGEVNGGVFKNHNEPQENNE